MVLKFLQCMDVSIVLLVQDYLDNKDASSCSMICICMQKRCREMKEDILRGRSERQLVIDSGRFWKFFDLDFQLKNRDIWNSLAKEAFLSEMKRLKGII